MCYLTLFISQQFLQAARKCAIGLVGSLLGYTYTLSDSLYSLIPQSDPVASSVVKLTDVKEQILGILLRATRKESCHTARLAFFRAAI